MIVPMKKVHVIVRKSDIVSALESLREMGTVHVEHQEELTGYQLEERREEVEILMQAIDILRGTKPTQGLQQKETRDWTEIVNGVLELSAGIERHEESMAKRQAQIAQWEPWGNFEPGDVAALAERGIYIHLCQRPSSKQAPFPRGMIAGKIYSSSGTDKYVVVSKEKEALPFETVALAPVSLKEMKAAQAREAEKISAAREKMGEYGCYLDCLERILIERENVLRFEEVERGMKEEESLALLKGFCPADACSDIARRAKKEKWAFLAEDPSEEDSIPTLLRNPRWVEMIKPIFGMINIMPGYKEFDISFLFLLFFTVFVGMLIGDAGYAVVYFLFFKFALPRVIKKTPEQKTFYSLMYLLCGSTFLWGVLSGTYFGQEWLPGVLRPVVPALRDTYKVQVLCFLIGAVHLSIAHIWRAVSKFPSAAFLCDVGWLVLCWGMFFLAKMLVLGDPFPAFAKIFFIVGIAGIVLFTQPNMNPLKAVGPGLGNLALNVINSFTDIVSYIRLFAVGLATVAVADAANMMSPAWVFFLHTLNILLAAMAILVHGLRLNVLEFSGHLGMEWAGFQYRPFKRIEKK